ncbi:hypothetical protein [Acidicapsa acidisoli]|nr:hypothetical protein [Acidicapsa acidisoli]
MTIATVENAGTNYKVTSSTGEIWWVPKDPLNKDYVSVEAWIAAGGVVS